MKPLITLTSDFGIQSQGIGCMEAVILGINPDANVVNLMHGLPDFDIITAARTMEVVHTIPIGYHVCVVDPGVGTMQKRIIIKAKRGDYLIGPDNGVLIPALKFLGGFLKAVEISNPKYMNEPVSPIFHGRDVFSPAAAYLSKGVPIEEFGDEIPYEDLAKPPYDEAIRKDGKVLSKIIHINKFGSLILNADSSLLDEFKGKVTVNFLGKTLDLPIVKTFGEVESGKPLIMKDDYGRIEVAVNLGNFSKEFKTKVGDEIVLG